MAKRTFSIFLLPWLPTTCLPSSCSVNTPCHSLPFSSTQMCLHSNLFPYMHRHAGRASLLVPALFLFLPSLCAGLVHSALCSLCTGTGFTLRSLGNFTLSHFPDFFFKTKQNKTVIALLEVSKTSHTLFSFFGRLKGPFKQYGRH